MPLKSKSQLRRLEELVRKGEMTPEKLAEFKAATPSIAALPDRVKKEKSLKIGTVKVIGGKRK